MKQKEWLVYSIKNTKEIVRILEITNDETTYILAYRNPKYKLITRGLFETLVCERKSKLNREEKLLNFLDEL